MAAIKKTAVPVEAQMSVSKLVVDPSLNVRMRKGSVVHGVEIKNDGYDLQTMVAQIVERGKILEQIHVSNRKDGTFVVLRGNRRTLAGQSLLADTACPEELKKELSNVRVLVFSGLTSEEEREKVMDQNSKPFARSEIIRYAWSLRQQGQSFERIAVDNFEMWGQFGRNARTTQKLIDIRSIPEDDLNGRRKAIKTWLRGTVDEYVIPAFDLGPIVQKACLLSEMDLDGLLKGVDEKPYFYTTRDPQKRMKLLGQAREKDGTKWNPHTGGDNFNVQIEEFHKQDFPTGLEVTTGTEETRKRKSLAELKALMSAAMSSPARMAYSIASGNKEEDFIARDTAASLLEAKENLYLQFAEQIKPDASINLRDVLTQVFLMDNVLDFKQLLEKHSVPQANNVEEQKQPTSTETPESKEPETVNADGSFNLK